jgi:hypothetical protein
MITATEYHPPLTGLESHMEHEIAEQAHRQDEAEVQAQQSGKRQNQPAASPETEMDRKVEEFMHLDL